MDIEILNKLKENLFKKYSYFKKEYLFIEIDKERGIINIYNAVYMDNFLNYKKIDLIKKYIYNFLKSHKQEGFFYICNCVIDINDKLKGVLK